MSNIVPSNPTDRQKLKAALVEITNVLALIDAEKEKLKEIVADAEEQFDIKKKLISKLGRTMYKRNYQNLQQENEDFEELYEIIVENKKITAQEAA